MHRRGETGEWKGEEPLNLSYPGGRGGPNTSWAYAGFWCYMMVPRKVGTQSQAPPRSANSLRLIDAQGKTQPLSLTHKEETRCAILDPAANASPLLTPDLKRGRARTCLAGTQPLTPPTGAVLDLSLDHGRLRKVRPSRMHRLTSRLE